MKWQNYLRRLLSMMFLAVGLCSGGALSFADGGDSADSPQGFGSALEASKGVILRVPINAAGEENTSKAEFKFSEMSSVSADSNPEMIWRQGTKVNMTDEVSGINGPAVDPKRDSSTWGWYSWYGYGWRYPYYYSWYYPTFYYNYSWYYYRYYYSWSWYSYRYYYYYWWW